MSEHTPSYMLKMSEHSPMGSHAPQYPCAVRTEIHRNSSMPEGALT
jgi:hypothetical protein